MVIRQQIGSYRVVRQIGEGGMGAVYEAVHRQIGRRAAIKVLHSWLSSNPQLAVRFLNEARAVNIIQHPGIAGAFEFGQLPAGEAYIVMEYLDGESLAARIRREGRLLGEAALRLGRQIASAVGAAHERGIVHRDLKPDNIMIVQDPEAAAGERAKILDFGIAKLGCDEEGGRPQRTLATAVMGTPLYMAPEQCRGAGGVTDKADVYALGVILFEMLVGVQPFMGANSGEIMAQHMYGPVPRVQLAAPHASAQLSALVESMLAKAPAQRPTMLQVEQQLLALGAATSARSLPPVLDATGSTMQIDPRHRQRPHRAWQMATMVVGAALAALLGLQTADMLEQRGAPERPALAVLTPPAPSCPAPAPPADERASRAEEVIAAPPAAAPVAQARPVHHHHHHHHPKE